MRRGKCAQILITQLFKIVVRGFVGVIIGFAFLINCVHVGFLKLYFNNKVFELGKKILS